jgi:hypothetical protein
MTGTLTAHGTATDVVLDVRTTQGGDEVGTRAPRLLVGHRIGDDPRGAPGARPHDQRPVRS